MSIDFNAVRVMPEAASSALLSRTSSALDVVSHVSSELEHLTKVLHMSRVRQVLDSSVANSCRAAQKVLVQLHSRLAEVSGQLETFAQCRLRASGDVAALQRFCTKHGAELNAAHQRQSAALHGASLSLDRLVHGRLLAPAVMDRGQSTLSRVLSEVEAPIASRVGEWVTLKELEVELGSEVRMLLAGSRKPSPSELSMLTYALKELVDVAEADVSSAGKELDQAKSKLRETLGISETLLDDVSKLEAAIAAVDSATSGFHEKQVGAYREAVNRLLEQFHGQRRADHIAIDDAEANVAAQQQLLAQHEDDCVDRFLRDPVHQKIHNLSECLIKPTVGQLASAVASRSVERERRHTRHTLLAEGESPENSLLLDDLMVISDAGVRNMIRRRRQHLDEQARPRGVLEGESQSTLEFADEVRDDEFLVVRDEVDGTLRVVQVLSGKDAGRQYTVAATSTPGGAVEFVIDRSSANLPSITITTTVR